MKRMHWLGTVLTILSLTGANAASAADPPAMIGGNTVIGDSDGFSDGSVAMEPDGDFVTCWRDPSDTIVNVQRYRRDGKKVGSLLQAQGAGKNVDDECSIAVDPNGNGIVAFAGPDNTSGDNDIKVQRFDTNGLVGAPLVWGSTSSHWKVVASMDAYGNTLVTWAVDDHSIRAVRRSPTGTLLADVLIGTNLWGYLDASMGASGQFAVAWDARSTTFGFTTNAVYVQRFAANGAKIGPVLKMPKAVYDNAEYPSLAMSPDGSIGVTWMHNEQHVFVQRYGSNGTALFAPIQISEGYPTEIAVDAFGRTLVSWRGGGGDYPVWVSRLDALGNADPAINVRKAEGRALRSTVAMDADGDAVVLFNLVTVGNDSVIDDSWAMFQRLRGPEAVDLSVWQSDSSVVVSPSSNYSYSIDVSNRHVPSHATGIASVDQGIGTALQPTVKVQLSSGVSLQNFSGSGAGWTCNTVLGIVCTYGEALRAGTTAPSLVVNVKAPSTAGTASSTATHVPVQIDPQSGDNVDVETTTIGSASPFGF